MGLGLTLSPLWVPGRRALLVEDELHPIFTSFSDGSRECVSCAFRTHNLQSSPDLMQASGQGALTTAPYQPTLDGSELKGVR